MSTAKYHPNLMIMYKTVGFGYAEETSVFRIDGQNVSADQADADAGDDSYDYLTDPDFDEDEFAEADVPEYSPSENELIELLNELVPVKKTRTGLDPSQRELLKQVDESGSGIANIMTVYEQCNAHERSIYMDWYYKANAQCKKLAAKLKPHIDKLEIDSDPVEVVVGVVAATSQGTLWEDNLKLANQIIETGKLPENMVIVDSDEMLALKKRKREINKLKKEAEKQGLPVDERIETQLVDVNSLIKQLKEEDESEQQSKRFKITKQNLKNVQRILDGGKDVLQSSKFKTFEASIIDPKKYERSVVVDTHAACIWIGKRLGVQSKEFSPNRPDGTRLAIMTRDYRRAADRAGVTPQAMQALTWSAWRRLPPKFMVKYMRDLGPDRPSSDLHPESEMFKAFYPYLYAVVNKDAKKLSWRWKFDKIGKLSKKDVPKGLDPAEFERAKELYEDFVPPRRSAEDFLNAVKRFGTELWRYYNFPEDAWKAFIAAHPRWAEGLYDLKKAHEAAMLEAAARSIAARMTR